MHAKIKTIICLIAWIVLWASPGFSEDAATEVTVLDNIVVTSSPIVEANTLDRYAGQKTVVGEEQIDDLNAQDLGTALRKTPGVNISRYNAIGSFGGAEGGGVFIRGMGSSRPGAEIKTLVDGVPMYMSVWNHPLLDLMPVDSGSSVEVYKSPQPQHFGNAFGIVNLLPKRKKEEGVITKGQVAGGSNNTFVGKAEHGGKLERFDYYIGGGYRSSDGHRSDSAGELKNLYGRMGFQLSDNWDLSVFSLWNDNFAEDPGAEGSEASEKEGTYETRAWLATATLVNRFDRAEGYLKFYTNSGEGDWLDNPTPTPGVTENQYNDFLFHGIKAKETFYLGKGGEFLVGADWDYSEGDYDETASDGTTDRWGGHDFTILSPYTAISWQLGNKDGLYVIPSAGVRYYDNSDFDSETAPHAGLITGYRGTEFHVAYSRGVVYPGLDVVVFSEKVIPALGDSWKDLEAEKVDHYEAGISQKIGDVALLELTCFYDDGKDRYVFIPPPPPPPMYSNIEEFTIRGTEASLSIYPAENLSLFAGATFLDTDPGDMPYAPDTTLSAGLNWRFLQAFKLSLDASYVSDMNVNSQARKSGVENTAEVDSYFLVNGKVSYNFNPETLGFEGEFFVAGENLTDEEYEYLPGYSMPGLSGMAGVSLLF